MLALVFFTVNAFGGTPTITCALNGFTNAQGVPVTELQEGDSVTITATFTTDGTETLPAGDFSFWNADTQVQITGVQAVTKAGSTYTVTDTTASLQPGTYAVTAQFLPPLFPDRDRYGTCETAPPQTLTIDPKQPTKTTTTVDISRSIANVGDQVTLTAHIEQVGAPLAPVGGNVIFSVPGVALADHVMVTNNTATATVTIGLPAGAYDVQALYSGDYTDNLEGSSGTVALTVHDTSSLTYSGDPTVEAGRGATLGGTLRDSLGRSIGGRTVTFAVAGTSAECTARTDDYGEASCTTTPVDAALGTYTVTATFAGDEFLTTSTDTGTITVQPGPTHTTYTGPHRAIVGRTISLSAAVTNDSGEPVPGAPVALSIAGEPGETCGTATDPNGVASCDVYIALAAGKYTVTASYDGSLPQYTASSGSGSLAVVVTVPTTLTYEGPTSAAPGTPVALPFLLTDDQHEPLPSMLVTIGGEPATTDSQGVATVTKTFSLGGDYPITATFDGDDPYLPQSATATIHVDPAPTTLTISAPQTVQIGQPLTITATLTTSTDHVHVAGKAVELLVDGQPCTGTTGTTDASGTITCTSTAAAPARRAAITANFTGDTQALPSQASDSTYVYGLAPGGGMFVVGNSSATGLVTFWGAQWAKLNPLANGAPNAFKGFADAAMPQCGGTWTTRPGNSTPPPNGQLPAYMGVVVSSSISKSGSVITGDVKRIVVVATNSDVAPDPGHAGTGAVVISVCPAG